MLDEQNRSIQARQKVYEQRERQQFLAILILFVIVSVIIGALYLVQATTNVGNARDIESLRDQRSRLEREIEALRAENAELNSIPRLQQRAEELGFRKAAIGEVQWLTIDGYVYDQPAPTLTPVMITPTPQVYEDNFAGWVKQQLDWVSNQFDSWSRE